MNLMRNALTEVLQDVAIFLALILALKLSGWSLNFWQWVILTLFGIVVAAVHYQRGLRYGLRFVITSFIKEHIEK